MIPIATPLADKKSSELILKHTRIQKEKEDLISGIKACQKAILKTENPGIMVFSATTSPMDLITHIPILCEERNIPYIFVEDESFINGFTCVLLKDDANDKDFEIILASCWPKVFIK